MIRSQASYERVVGWTFRVALFAAAASLAVYIPYKYATQLHAVTGIYAFLFPLSALLAAAGIVLAVKPQRGCDCGVSMRAGVGALSALWLATGVLCVGSLTVAVMEHPMHGSIATFHMLVQHVFLSLSLIAFAFMPDRMAEMLGFAVPRGQPSVSGAVSSASD